MSDLDNQRHNRVRQLILRTLSQCYPQSLDAQLLRATLANLGHPMDERTLRFYVCYLQERGYLRLDDKPEYQICLVTITASGIDAMDGRIKDCGLDCGAPV